MKKLYFYIIFMLLGGCLYSQAPVITEYSSEFSNCIGESIELFVFATGEEPLLYQWKKEGVDLPGQTGSTLLLQPLAAQHDGGYTCMVSNAIDTAESDSIIVKVAINPPHFTTHPVDKNMCEGTSDYLTTILDGEYLEFDWYHDNQNIFNAHSSFYSFGTVDISDVGTFFCISHNACGEDTSNSAVIAVTLLPQISTGPVNREVCLGNNTSFSVTASGTNINYQWYKDNVPISGANTLLLSISNVDFLDAGIYFCSVWNSCDSFVSNSAVLGTRVKPTVTAQPYLQSGCAGENVEFLVTAIGTPPLSFQWFFNNTAIGGAMTNSLNINNISNSSEGFYHCFVGNICGNVFSDTALLDIKQPPAIFTQPIGSILCSGDSAELSVKVTGFEPFTFQWRQEGANELGANENTYSISVTNVGDSGHYTCLITNACGQVLSDTAVLVIQTIPVITFEPVNTEVCENGTFSLSLTVQGSQPFSYTWKHNGLPMSGINTGTLTVESANATNTGTYNCIVGNMCGSDTSQQAMVSFKSLPQIIIQPQGATKCPGQSHTFLVSASGTAPLTYHWLKNNNQIAGATNSSYTLSNLTEYNEGNYSCRVYNSCGNDVSNAVMLTIGNVPMMNTILHNRTRCEGDSVSFKVLGSGESITYQWLKNEVALTGETGTTLLYNNLQTIQTGKYKCKVLNSCGFDTTNSITLTVNAAANVDLGNDKWLCDGDSVVLNAGVFAMYHWNETLAYSPSLIVKNSGTFVLEAWNGFSCYGSDTVNVTVSPVIPVNLGNNITACGSHTLDAGVSALSYNWNSGMGSEKTFTVTQTGTYFVVVTAQGGCETTDTIDVTIHPTPVFSLGADTFLQATGIMILQGPSGYSSYVWNGNIISESFEVNANLLNPGQYAYSLQIGNEFGCKTTDVIVVTILVNSIDENNSNNLLRIYPIPATDVVTLNLEKAQSEKYNLEITNAIGQIVFSKKTDVLNPESTIAIPVSNFPKGAYLIRLFSTEKYYVRKLIVQ